MSKFELFGTREDPEYGYDGYTGRRISVRNLVATFRTRELAQDYACKSELASSKNNRHAWDKAFRQKSLLCGYTGYEIEEEYIPMEVEHDPVI